MYTRYLFRWLVAFMSLVLSCVSANGEVLSSSSSESVVTFELQDEALEDVSKKIYKQTGYKVFLQEEWKKFSVSGLYQNVTLENFFRRSLRGHNISCIVDYNAKSIHVGFFGRKKKSKGLPKGVASYSNTELTTTEDDVLHRNQLEELREHLADPDSVDLMSGMKLSEIRRLHDAQEVELEEMRHSADAVEIKALHAVQLKELEEIKKSPDAVDVLSGMTLSQVKVIAEKQMVAHEKKKNDPARIIDVETGVTAGDLKKMHALQYEDFTRKYPNVKR